MKTATLMLLALLLTSGIAAADMSMNAFDRAMTDDMARMDKAMAAAPMTADPDHDFMAMMIPHHQGAIEMAQSELQNGHDVRVERLAREIIVTQESEIQLMRSYLTSASHL
jgi:uncharacterized protein (DUF305 family)